jgi:acetyltransferase-like isoleucine patch superfamily enzyme
MVLLKTAARLVSFLLSVPLLLVYWLQAAAIGRDRSLEGCSEFLALLPGLPGQYLRRAFLWCVLERCHPSACIGFGVLFSKVGARIDENVYIGPRCHIGLAHLERNVLLGAAVHVTSGARMHGTDDPARPIREQAGVWTRVCIGEGSWIGSAAVVMADVGRNSIVGAGAVVTKPLPDGVTAGGVPARILSRREGGSGCQPAEHPHESQNGDGNPNARE